MLLSAAALARSKHKQRTRSDVRMRDSIEALNPCQFNASDDCIARMYELRGGKTALVNMLPEISAQLERTRRGVFIDCGCNEGDWLVSLLKALHIHNASLLQYVYPIWIEPSRRYYKRLQKLALTWNGHHLARAAWVSSGTMMLHESRNAMSSSLSNASAARYGTLDSYTVETFDLARLVRSHAGATIVMKHDIEASEYTTLPHLVSRSMHCQLNFLSVEWHLSALPPQQRLVALAFEHAMPAVLSGCASRIYYEGQSERNMNRARVPGLSQLARYQQHDETQWERIHRAMAAAGNGSTSTTSTANWEQLFAHGYLSGFFAGGDPDAKRLSPPSQLANQSRWWSALEWLWLTFTRLCSLRVSVKRTD